jgi:hypothetical protein
MKKIICCLLFLVSYSAYSQIDTILYSSGCDTSDFGGQKIFLQLKNDTLTLTGKIIANCCGTHFIKYELFESSIYLTRIDTGELCDCYCLYDIDIKIGNCTSNYYNVKLHELSGNDGLDTLIKASQSGINNIIKEKETVIFPNPFKESATITFSNPDLKYFTFKMFDSSGRLIKTINDLNTTSFQLFRENLNAGFYYFFLYNSDKIRYSGKLLIH